MKLITYKGQKVNKPDDISLRKVKQLIDIGDYCLTVQQVIDIFSTETKIESPINQPTQQ